MRPWWSGSASTCPPGPASCAAGPGALAATSLHLEGAASLDRTALLAEILAGLERRYQAWCRVFGDSEQSGLAPSTPACAPPSAVASGWNCPASRLLDGLAAGVDADGRLLVSVPPDADLPVAAGDIVHLR